MGLQAPRCLAFAAALVTLTPAHAFEVRNYPEFVQIDAIAPRAGGGFAIAGLLRGEGNRQISALLEIAANGDPIGRPAILPVPDAQHPQVWVSGLLALPGGDYVVSGWAEVGRKADGWVARVAPNGDYVWNITTQYDWEQRLYSVKRLSNGNVVAVGRVQQGNEARQGAHGFAVVLDELTGEELFKKNYPFNNTTARAAFQDVAELPDGTLVFVGWMTKQDATDDIWVQKTSANGDRVKSVTFGEAANDVAYSVMPFGSGVAIAGTTRKTRDISVGTLAVYDKDLTRRTTFNLDRWAPGISQGRAAFEIASTGQVVVVGQNQKTATADPIALAAIVSTQATSATAEDAGAAISTFRAVAVDGAGTIAMAGDAREAKDRPLRGFLGLRAGAAACTPDQKRIDEISAALVARAKQRLVACAQADRPTRFRVGNGGRNLAVVVRPIVGDVDAFLMRGSEILDTSLNSMQRAEVFVLPPSGTNYEVAVAGVTPYSSFEIGVVALTPPDPGNAEGGEAEDAFTPRALRWLGYDLLGSEHVGERAEGVGLRRAIMAFQAGEGFPITGNLQTEHLDRLFGNAARVVDIDARKAADTAREVARNAAEVQYTEENFAVRSLRLGIRDGRVYGVGQLRFGGSFEGEWLDGLDAGAAQRPGTGVLRVSNDCSIALRYLGDQTIVGLDGLLEKSIGVLRHRNKIAFARDLTGLVPEGEDAKSVTLAKLCTPQR